MKCLEECLAQTIHFALITISFLRAQFSCLFFLLTVTGGKGSCYCSHVREEKTDIRRLYHLPIKSVAALKPYSLTFYTLHVGPQFFLISGVRILLSIKSRYSYD